MRQIDDGLNGALDALTAHFVEQQRKNDGNGDE